MKKMLSVNDVCGAVVTYGNRANLLEKTIQSFIDNGVSEIICVFNGCDDHVYDYISDRFKNKIRLTPVILKSNLGSAGGFTSALEAFKFESGKELVWILDDDNFAEKNALDELINFANGLSEVAIVCSNRTEFNIFGKLESGIPIEIMYPKNSSFLGISIWTIFPTTKRFFNKRIGNFGKSNDVNWICVPQVPWGGMLIPRAVLDNNILPPKEFYLYADDTAFCVLAGKYNFRFFIVKSSRVIDLDASYHLEKADIDRFSKIILSTPVENVNYSVRNNCYIDRNLRPKNSMTYIINKNIYMIILLIFCLKYRRLGRFIEIGRLVSLGERGKLGIMQ
ncbi:glycosyltransferase [Deinococcus aquiradiocola]|uniref:Glycosyltransferase 2-like domain-containing protein n=1 Tax=Deinococcus aquiradiocola TaxID=393059 RepID=A0A917PHP4_9DEIO|nr:glycosyltransferase [Deinococcus aquiradiocola]GGJ78212.1 hypothetical protein GCM10008939_22740 [Deinococcus aquiradiocola]